MKRKKNFRQALFALMVAVALCAVADCVWALTDLGENQGKLWLHRTNSLEKLREKEARFPNVEVDVCFRADSFDVTHDADTTFRLSLGGYMQHLGNHPQRRMWLDLKTLTEANKVRVLHVLDSLTVRYGVEKAQLIVESREWECLSLLRKSGYYTSYYVPYDSPSRMSQSELATCIAEIRRAADSGAVSAISFPSKWYRTLKRELSRPIDMLTWAHRSTEFELLCTPLGRQMLHDPQLKVILVKSKGQFHR